MRYWLAGIIVILAFIALAWAIDTHDDDGYDCPLGDDF